MGRMTDERLERILTAEIAHAKDTEELAAERAENIKFYKGEKFGNEIKGRSQVVTTDVADTIEWILPELIRIFASGEEAVAYQPVGPEDVAVAEQATEYANYIWMRDNEGFMNYYVWFKDALISKDGFIKIWWDEREEDIRIPLEGIDEMTFANVVAPDEVTVSEHTENEDGTHDVVLTVSKVTGRVKVQPVPPEDFLTSGESMNLEDCRFNGVRCLKTRSDLIAQGFDKELVRKLPTSTRSEFVSEDEDTREDYGRNDSPATTDKSMEEVEIVECYVRVDWDGDDIAEMRQVTVGIGTKNIILKNEAWNDMVPFAHCSPIKMPHEFNGVSIADLVKELQLIKSTIMRQYLDGLYLANHPREEVVEPNIIDPAELLKVQPGAKIRVKQAGSITPLSTGFQGAQALEGLAYVDQLRENRTGISPRTQGLGDNPLHETLGGEQLLLNAAQGKVELIARVMAETGVKRAFQIILGLITRYQEEIRNVQIKQQWVEMNPRDWNPKMNVAVSVGMGTGDKAQQLTMAFKLLELQKEALAMGFARPDQLLETATIIVNAMGFKGVERFFDVLQQGQQQQQPDPELIKAQAKAQTEIQKAEIQAKTKLEIARMENETDMEQFDEELDLKRRQIGAEIALKRDVTNVEMGGRGG